MSCGPVASWETVSYHKQEEDILGCQHYRRNIKLQANCCGKWVTCRFCHDASSSHDMDRFSTKKMVCMYCKKIQRAQQDCQHCHLRMAAYYCDICKFWDDTPDKNIYHCNGCGICRVGKGPNIDFKHCYKCTLCVPMHLYDSHKCIEYNSKADCPMCGEYLFTTIKPIMFMKCQHMIHECCYTMLTEDSFQCPVCSKSLDNAAEMFSGIDKGISKIKTTENLRRSISCFDCNQLSIAELDLIYHKCGKCGSYSTKVLDTFNMNYSINIERYNINKEVDARHVRSNKKVAADQVSLSTLIDQMESYNLNESDDYDDAYSPSTCSCLSKGFTEYDSDFSASSNSSCYCGKSSDWSSYES